MVRGHHSPVRDATDATFLGTVVVLAWVLLVDSLGGQPFRTTSLIGQTILGGTPGHALNVVAIVACVFLVLLPLNLLAAVIVDMASASGTRRGRGAGTTQYRGHHESHRSSAPQGQRIELGRGGTSRSLPGLLHPGLGCSGFGYSPPGVKSLVLDSDVPMLRLHVAHRHAGMKGRSRH